MRALVLSLCAVLTVSACEADETISGHGGAGHIWILQEIDGQAFDAQATIEFPEEGKITGQGPCNRFSATQSVPYPWFEAGPIMATKMACPDLAAEQVFFTALAEMTLSEVAGDTLILSNDAGRDMVFKAQK
ncbi:META domain-containing protein [Roseovarius sp. 2305UL8-3]|uniref:META domain-containing protein n=1 Tax=Roseovarius conchicola TaxID=3121636 RepID=UPI0035287355